MRYSEFITETEIPVKVFPVETTPGFQELAQLLKTQCGDYLDIFNHAGRVLYRGTDPAGLPQAFSGRSRDDRRPLHSNPTAQRMVDNALTKLGIAARRGNSLFTTSDQIKAKEFGGIYIIIPKNSAVYSWSNDPDMTLTPSSVRLLSNSRDWGLLKRAADEADRIVKDAMDAAYRGSQRGDNTGYDVLQSNVDHAAALAEIAQGMYMVGKNDIPTQMSDPITAKPHLDWVVENWPGTVLGTYIAREMYQSLDKPVEIDPQKLQAKYNFTDKNLEAALKNGNEVLIHGEYIAMRPAVWNHLTARLGLI